MTKQIALLSAALAALPALSAAQESPAGQLGLAAGKDPVELADRVREFQNKNAGEVVNGFIQTASRMIKTSDDPGKTGAELARDLEDLLRRAGPDAATSLAVFRDKTLPALVEAREEELYKKNIPPGDRAEEAAAKLRELVAQARGAAGGFSPIRLIREVSVEKDFLGRPRLRLVVPRLCARRSRYYPSDKEGFEAAVERNFSDVPEPHDMSWFGIGYRIVYVEDDQGCC